MQVYVNSPVKVDLFSSAIFKVHFLQILDYFLWITCVCVCFPCLYVGLIWPVLQRNPSYLRMSQLRSPSLFLQMKSTGTEICLLNMVSKTYFTTFLANFQSSTGLYYVVRIPKIIFQPGVVEFSEQQRHTGFFEHM